MPQNWEQRLGGLPMDVAMPLLQDPNVRALMIQQGVTLDRAAAALGRVPDGYKSVNGALVQDHSVRNGVLIGAGILGGGLGAQALTGGFGAGAGAATGAGPLASGETGMAATAAAGIPPASLAATVASTASKLPSWLLPAISAGAPLAIRAATGTGSSGTSGNGLNTEQNDLLTQLIRMSQQRQDESAPVHQAAMRLAGSLAPTGTWADSPRFQNAVQQTGGPGPASTMNPQIADAVARLMKGGM